MKLMLLQKIIALSTLNKAIAFKKGALIALSFPVSLGIVGSINELIKNVEPYDLALPIVSIVGCVILYLIFWIIDFVSGLVASRYENKENDDWVKSEKLYNSLGKFGGVLLVDFLLLCILLFLVVIGFVTVSIVLLIITVLINVLAMLYEFQSIGENIKRRTGTKPTFYMFFDRLTSVVENIIIKKVKSGLGGSDENNEINDNEY